MKIEFIPGSQRIFNEVDCPIPSRYFIPDWYKNISPKASISGIKKCIPFLDSLSSGYIQATWADILIEKNGSELTVSQKSDIEMIYERQTDVPIGKEFYDIEFVWRRPWSIVLPKGFSALITHPLNRIDLPFYTLTGIVDVDKAINTKIGNIPFYIKSGFTGIIPKGTPMFQIIPITRGDWVLEKNPYSESFWKEKLSEREGIDAFYKKKKWQKKKFD